LNNFSSYNFFSLGIKGAGFLIICGDSGLGGAVGSFLEISLGVGTLTIGVGVFYLGVGSRAIIG
jgi:hypothetical protein